MSKYCNSRTTMGHGEVAVCGKDFYEDVYQCNACKLAESKEETARYKAMYERGNRFAEVCRLAIKSLKPTESGASDKCFSDGGTCGLGGQCNKCPHKESGVTQ